MDILHCSRRTEIDWLAAGPIAPYVDAFKEYLTERQCAARTVTGYLSNIAHFARWARARRLRLNRLDESAVDEFLDKQLVNCRCTGRVRRDRSDHRAALRHLLVVLRSKGAIAPPTVSTTPVDRRCLPSRRTEVPVRKSYEKCADQPVATRTDS